MKKTGGRAVHCLTLGAALLVACGDSGDSGAGADSGICGTANEPGVLKLSNLLPVLGGSVVNRAIVHSFTVVNAPADFYSFDLLHGDGHSAGLSTPDSPRFKTTRSGNNISYQMTIDSWSNVPGHVVLNAAGTFQTSQGCTWAFPTPMFSYDVKAAPVLDGGATLDVGSADAPRGYDLAAEVGLSVDSVPDVAVGPLDVSSELDALTGMIDASLGVDGI